MFADNARTVLVVEDDAGIAELEQMQLKRAGFSVLTAETPEEALDQLRRHRVNLVLLDYRLAGDVDGLEVHAHMREAGFDMPVILVTGFSNEALAIRALRAGVRDFVTKSPEYLDFLPEAVDRVLKQVETEHRLAETEARLTSIIDSAKDAIIIADADQRITLFNRAAEAMFRCPASLAVGEPVTRFIAHENLAVSNDEPEKPHKQKGSLTQLIQYGNRGVRADETEFPLEASLSRATVDGRKFYTLIVRDVTSRKKAEESLAAERNLLRTLIDALPDVVFTKDTSGRFAICNSAALLLAGLKREEEMAGKTAFDLFPREMAEIYDANDRQILAGQAMCNQEEPCVNAAGLEVWYHSVKVPLRDKDGAIVGLVGISRDITDRKRAEEMLAERARLAALSADVGVALTTTQALRETLQCCAAALAHNLEGAFARIWTFNDDENVLELQASAGIYTHIDGPHSRVPIGKYKIGRIAQQRKPLLTNDLQADSDISDPDWAKREGIVALAGYPLLLEDRLVGVMAMFDCRPISQATLDAMGAVANQIGQFIERKRAEQELQSSEERFRLIADTIDEVFWMSNVEVGKTLYISPGFERIWGRSCQSHLENSRSYLDSVHPEDRERIMHDLESQKEGLPFDHQYRIARPDGSIRWIWDRGFPIAGPAGKAVHYVGVAQDITERRQAEIAMQQQQHRLEGIVNSAMDGIITIDEGQRIILINAAAERMFDCKSAEVLGQSVDRFIPERYRARHAEYVREFGRTGVAARTMGTFGQINGLRAGGEEFPIEASISQLVVENRKLFTVTCRDITERVRAAQTRQKLEDQLRQSQKMDAFGQLAGGVAHDFNNLLTVITGYSEMLLMMFAENDPKRESVKAISDAGERAASLTRQLLAFSRKTMLEPKVLDVNEVVRETEKMLRRLIGEDILLTAHFDRMIRQVKVDPGLLGQVLMNLAVNSRDAMPQGGKLAIETGNVELDAQFPVASPDFRPGWYVMLAVTDTGCGMTPEVKARIFEPFFTTKGVGKGTGLGLAVVHGIVSQSGGQIDVESTPGQGTTFKIYLPALDAPLSSRDGVELFKDWRGSETILLVEDDESVRALTSLILRTYGYHVLIARDGKDALRVVEARQGGIDLLLTDVVMPHLSGRELADALQPRFPKMKVLYMSGYTDDTMLRHGLVHEKVPFLQKPATPLKLVSKVRNVLDAHG